MGLNELVAAARRASDELAAAIRGLPSQPGVADGALGRLGAVISTFHRHGQSIVDARAAEISAHAIRVGAIADALTKAAADYATLDDEAGRHG